MGRTPSCSPQIIHRSPCPFTDCWHWPVDGESYFEKSIESHYAHDGRRDIPSATECVRKLNWPTDELTIFLTLFNTDLRPMPEDLALILISVDFRARFCAWCMAGDGWVPQSSPIYGS